MWFSFTSDSTSAPDLRSFCYQVKNQTLYSLRWPVSAKHTVVFLLASRHSFFAQRRHQVQRVVNHVERKWSQLTFLSYLFNYVYFYLSLVRHGYITKVKYFSNVKCLEGGYKFQRITCSLFLQDQNKTKERRTWLMMQLWGLPVR